MESKRGIAPLRRRAFRFLSRTGGNAMYHLFLCDEFSAARAREIGLVQEVVPAGQQVDRAMALAAIIARNAPLGIQVTKVAAAKYVEHGEAAAIAYIPTVRERVLNSADAREVFNPSSSGGPRCFRAGDFRTDRHSWPWRAVSSMPPRHDNMAKLPRGERDPSGASSCAPSVLLVAFLLALAAPACADDVATAQSVIRAQEQAFSRDDAAAACSHAAPEIRQIFPEADIFMKMVQQGYAPVYRHKSFEFGEARAADGRIAQRVHIVDDNGEVWEALYTLEQQPDGS